MKMCATGCGLRGINISNIQAGYRRTGIMTYANDVIEHLEIDEHLGEMSEESELSY